ncbi:hypothetical protein [Rhodocyclus tenuis]|uniref:Pimeloyl-ACP methyl ester carboxylesterase n=1 Tax=Rhodocyclus tenuis TaxID=1066 RepID=A0A840FUA6_RHOTE|nr:hypothetical protein [Rhodocyclus tenuis]MBB4245657.1 pimeloyl-ACP methyl ester carboxylesterase [Rhodocyclus tenuis]
MNLLRLLAALAIAVTGFPVQAQNILSELSGSTYREKTVYAVYDLPGKDLKIDVIETAVLDAIHLYARDAQVRQGIPPSIFPDYPGQMTLGRRLSGGPKPDCAGEMFSIEGIDSSMAKYGEKTYHRVCLFPHAAGYRINYFAIYGQQSGAGNSNPNVLAAMLGRAMGSAVGLGDSSSAINKLLVRLEGNLQGAGVAFKLVQLHPKDLAGRVVVEDDLPRPNAQTGVVAQAPAAPTPIQPTTVQPAPSVPGHQIDPRTLPPELAQLRTALMQQRETRQQLAAQQAAAGSSSKKLTTADARKELTATGLQYFNQEQFVAAIRRGDALAVELFIIGAGVDLNSGSPGSTPLAVAESSGRQDIVALLKNNGAH